MSEGLFVQHCSPTLAGLKAGSMFPCSYDTTEELITYVQQSNRALNPKGIRVVILRWGNGRALLYVFRPRAIEKILQDPRAVSLLRKRGYRHMQVDSCIRRLSHRIQQGGEFPHEVGLFLDYPPEDVEGFIENRASNQKCVGCWKVYGDEAAARKKFAMYKKCTRVYCSQWEQGKSIERLTVAG